MLTRALLRSVTKTSASSYRQRSIPYTSRVGRSISERGGRRFASTSKQPGLLGSYTALLDSKPLLTKSLTSLVITAAGDVGCHLLIEEGPFDFKRLFIFSGMGLVVVGPALHFWYGALNKIVPMQTTAGALYRLGIDQTIFAMPFIATFMSTVMVLEGKTEEIPNALRANWWSAVQTNWMIWIPANFLNFRFIQPRFQVLFANCVGFIWNSYLSFASHKGVAIDDTKKA